MFSNACVRVRESVYGIMCSSTIGNQLVYSTGTAFMIAPSYIITAAHVVHVESDINKPSHTKFELIRAPDIGQKMEKAQLIAEDTDRDVALLKIDNTRSNTYVTLKPNLAPNGTNCGSVGFPLAFVEFGQSSYTFRLVERFQGAYISGYSMPTIPSGRQLPYYETDALMYKGSSGCPGFLVDGNVFGMHNRSATEKAGKGTMSTETRLAISLWIPSMDIHQFAATNGVNIP